LGDRNNEVVIETALSMPGQFKAGKLNSQIRQENRGRSLERKGLRREGETSARARDCTREYPEDRHAERGAEKGRGSELTNRLRGPRSKEREAEDTEVETDRMAR
jgi:hypothetical protein